MRAIKRYMALAIVFLFIGAGCILLMLDFPTIKATWWSVIGAFLCIGAGLVLGHIFSRNKLIAE